MEIKGAVASISDIFYLVCILFVFIREKSGNSPLILIEVIIFWWTEEFDKHARKNEINIFSKRTNKFHVVLHVLQVKTQLKNSFVAYLNLIGCLFDRCIKPNWYQSPDRFDPDAVLAQVRSLAVVPTVQMRNLGFPVWFPFNIFIERSCLHFSRKITVCPQSIRS